jgi:hypothetical protein
MTSRNYWAHRIEAPEEGEPAVAWVDGQPWLLATSPDGSGRGPIRARSRRQAARIFVDQHGTPVRDLAAEQTAAAGRRS